MLFTHSYRTYYNFDMNSGKKINLKTKGCADVGTASDDPFLSHKLQSSIWGKRKHQDIIKTIDKSKATEPNWIPHEVMNPVT